MEIAKSLSQSFGDRLKYVRMLKGMTQAELAARVDSSVKHIGRIERGAASPSFSLIHDLAQALDTPPLNLFLHFEPALTDRNKSSPSPENATSMPSNNRFCFMARLATWFLGGPNLKPYWSDSLYALLGYAPCSVKPSIKRFLQHVHPSQQESSARFLKMAVQGRLDSGMQVDIMTRHDQKRTLMLNPDTFRTSSDDPVASQLIIQDVTDCAALNHAVTLRQEELEAYVVQKNQDLADAAIRYKLEAEQRKQAEKGLRIFEQMVDSSHDAQAFVDADGVIVAVNRAYEKLSGMSAADVEGRQWPGFLIDYWGQEVFDQSLKSRTEKALRSGDPGSFQEWRTFRTGKRKYVQVNYTPCRKNGDVAGVVVTLHDLTEFMETHERLDARQTLHQQILKTANEGILLMDAEQRITFANVKAGGLLGRRVEDLIGTLAFDYVHPEELKHTHAEIANIRSGKDVRYSSRLIHKTGREIRVLISASPVLTDQDQYNGTLAMLIDLTELKDTEAALERKTRELESLLDNLPLGIVAWDGAGNLLKSNNEFHEITGYPPGSTRTLEDWFPLAYPDERRRKEVMENGKQTTLEVAKAIREYPVTCADGKVKHVEFQGNFFADDCSFITMADVTQRKLAEQARLDSEERFRLLFQNAPMPYQSLDELGNFLDVNQAFLDALGYSQEELIGKNFGDILHPGWKDHFKENFPKFKAVGEVLGVEFEMVKKDGSTILVSYNGKIQKDVQGRFQRTHCIFQDVSEQRRIEQALRESREELKALLANKDKFFSIIAHDLRSPLSGLLGLANMVAEDDSLSPKDFRKIAKVMGMTVSNVFSLLENLLVWARMQRGMTAFEPAPCALREVIAKNTILLRTLATQKGITLNNTVPLKQLVHADLSMLDSVIRNLLSNALKFTYRGGTVEVRAMEKDAWVTVAVQDSGVGMDHKTLNGLFALSGKTSSRGTERESGSCLGLLLCKEFVEQHGGRIWVESAPGLGSTFFFTLPRC
jgi:PAS domain S-box-containing protein